MIILNRKFLAANLRNRCVTKALFWGQKTSVFLFKILIIRMFFEIDLRNRCVTKKRKAKKDYISQEKLYICIMNLRNRCVTKTLFFKEKTSIFLFKTLIIIMFLEINLRNRCVTKTLLPASIKTIIFEELLDKLCFLGIGGVFPLGDFGDLVR